MSKHRSGNKETKKPKKTPAQVVPVPPAGTLPAGQAAAARPKKS